VSLCVFRAPLHVRWGAFAAHVAAIFTLFSMSSDVTSHSAKGFANHSSFL
jgi:hypothetical protein